jgi:uncharacterized protein YecT (DUF1311 family)
LELTICFTKAREAADAQLNAAHKEIRSKLEGEDEKRLVTAQRLWIEYRDANCTAERELYAGHLIPSNTGTWEEVRNRQESFSFLGNSVLQKCTGKEVAWPN